ncbi:MAG: histidine--tRNA ligase [Ruminococcaceae bacterium]|nr:histidine--tRNA ligase [Oscillospiraceae bacterium]
MIQKARGTIDILPEDVAIWQYIEAKAREVAKRYGFGEIRFPTFEATELFQRGVGDTTDVVQKEMYTFTDRDNRSYTLRPEGTACVVRSIIENGKCSDALPLKLFYIINCFRYEKPQAGRSREFYQFGAEMFGTASPFADANIISFVNCFLQELGLSNYTLHINSIGCPECRPKHREALYNYFSERKDELCDTCRERLEKNPLRILDCKSPVCSSFAKDAPKTTEHLCDDCKKHMDTLTKLLDGAGIKYVIDPSVVRGLDYYTRTVFEFVCDDIGAQSTICGGGRYDGLVKELGGPAMPAIGFALGITRLILTMKEAGIKIKADNSPALYIAPLGETAAVKASLIAEELRRAGIAAECDIVGRSLKAQMKYSDKIGAKNTLIIGDSEAESGKAQLRRMCDGVQTEIDLNDIEKLKELL